MSTLITCIISISLYNIQGFDSTSSAGLGEGGGVRVLTMSNEARIVCSVSVRSEFRE